MNIHGHPPQKANYENLIERFGRGNSVGECDRILLETEHYYVTPSLGSIVPNWLLVWPRSYFLNCLDWRGSFQGINQLSEDVLQRLTGSGQTEHIWFEHGCGAAGSDVGCGVNFAHLHILVKPEFDFDCFNSTVETRSGMGWKSGAEPNPNNFESTSDYHLFGNSTDRKHVCNSTRLGSQFFRRAIAEMTGKNDNWNYRTHPFQENAARTVRNFAA